eukprot:TRINITY_DN67629_c1_g1_i1.p1 TRINITY_DN67629_c1_g1~~TRINITY_DN67629_c1_g1_i1.p1  ORF type:complete len:748 (-),score=87.67 TRINITY_DN67629_c1_g1_i1:80-2323(-)
MAHWDTRSMNSYASTSQVSGNQTSPEAIVTDPIRVDKTHKKLKAFLVQRGVNGIPSFTQLWHTLDNQHWDQNLTIWEFKRFFQTIDVKMDTRDVEVLFLVYDQGRSGEMDYDDFLLGIRSNVDMTQQQTEDIVKKIKTKIRTRYKGQNGRDVLLQSLTVFDTNTLNKGQYIEALSGLNLNLSRSELLFLFTQLHETQEGIDYIDAEVLAGFVMDEPTEEQWLGDIHCKMVEAMKDRDRPSGGSVGLLRYLKKIDTEDMNLLTHEQFKRGMKGYGCGLLDKEIDVLFDFYAEQSSNQLVIPDFIHAIRTEMGASPAIEWIDYLSGRLRGILTHRGAHGVVELKKMCAKHSGSPNGTLTLRQFATAIRDVGVGSVMPDIDIELLYNHFSDTQDSLQVPKVIEAIRGPISPPRMQTIQQAWAKIDPTGAGEVTIDEVLNVFLPSKLPEVQSRRRSEKDAFAEFADTFDEADSTNCGMATRRDFIDYWCNVSPSVPDTNEFSLSLWHVFELNKAPSRHHRQHQPQQQQQQQHTPQRAQQPSRAGGYSGGPFGHQQPTHTTPTHNAPPAHSQSQQEEYQQNTPPPTQPSPTRQQQPAQRQQMRLPAGRRTQAPTASSVSGSIVGGPTYGRSPLGFPVGQGTPAQAPPSPVYSNSPPQRGTPPASPPSPSRSGSSPGHTATTGMRDVDRESVITASTTSSSRAGGRFAHSRGTGGGHQTLQLFGGDGGASASGVRGKNISNAGRRELWKERPW